jgi:nitronate monooxygenase
VNLSAMKELKLGDLTVKLPIIQGGMGVGVSLSGLAAAVANEGGVGVIASAAIGMFEPDFSRDFLQANINALRKEIRKAREMTKGIIGVNVMVALSNFADMVKTAIEEKVDIIFSGAGLPLNLPQFLEKNSRTKLVPIVSSARAAKLIMKRWMDKYQYLPDAVVVEGPKAGGHLGFNAEQLENPEYDLENLLPKVISEVQVHAEKHQKTIPVIAAGGIYSGADIHKFMQLGAGGVQMATRFVTTVECDAALEFKQTYLNSRQEDLVIIKSPVGLLGRAFKNTFLDDVFQGKKKPFNCPFHCITTCDYQHSPYCIAMALINAQRGNLKHGFAFSGTNGYLAKKIISVKELIKSLTEEYTKAVNSTIAVNCLF